MKTLLNEFKLQEAVTTIRVQCIINSIKEQYCKELNKDYFGYANQTIKMLQTKLVEGHDKRVHQCVRGILSGMGPLGYQHHHLQPSAQ